VPLRTLTVRLLIISTTVLIAAFNGGWKWDFVPH
jgi:hypothetical protein